MTVTRSSLTTPNRRTPAQCQREFRADCTSTVTASQSVESAEIETASSLMVTARARSSSSTFDRIE
jgi:hypothetical protein